MKHPARALFIFSLMSSCLTGCVGESACKDYRNLTELDRNGDLVTDYRFQFIGDSIIAYHDTYCNGVGHDIGFMMGEKINTRAVIGATVDEIGEQFEPAPDFNSDYEVVVINGGLNDLISDINQGDSAAPACDCNGNLNHEACLSEVDAIGERMARVIDKVHAATDADLALVGYYPAEKPDSFIGQCFPYVEQLHQRYQELSDIDPKLNFVPTYGEGISAIQKINQFGYDNYHPTPVGSKIIAEQIYKVMNLDTMLRD